jgi:hypothetical protein
MKAAFSLGDRGRLFVLGSCVVISSICSGEGVTQPAVARMESGKNVSIRSLSRYATDVGKPIQLVINPATAATGAD